MSAKQSIASNKLEQEAKKEIREGLEKSIARAQIMERFYNRELISGDKSVQLILGKTQSELRQWKKLLTFLDEAV